jgi:hypothetical protein
MGVANLIQGVNQICYTWRFTNHVGPLTQATIFHYSDVFLVHAAAAKTGTSLAEGTLPNRC